MALAMKATVTTMSVMPCWRRRPTTCSIIGRLAIGSIGFGWFEVNGRSLVPSPPAMITAFTVHPSLGDLRGLRRPAPAGGPSLLQRLPRRYQVGERRRPGQPQTDTPDDPGDVPDRRLPVRRAVAE